MITISSKSDTGKKSQWNKEESDNKNREIKDASSVKSLGIILVDSKKKTDQGVNSAMVAKASPHKGSSQ